MCCAAALTIALAPGVRADEWDKKTILTFSGPVQIPGATLPAGSYVFKLADIAGNRHVVQVFDKDERKLYTTILAIPNERLDPTDDPVVLFAERSSGSPQAVKVWFYPGNRVGNEFVYPKSQAMRIAKETHQSVLATNDESTNAGTAGEIPSGMKTAELGRFDENGSWQSDNKTVAVNGNQATPTTTPAETQATTADRTASAAPAPEATRATIATPAPAPTIARATPATPRAAGTSGARPARKSLPRTASSLAFIELMSGLALGSALMLHQIRKRMVDLR
jgi:hypothetical protein